MKKLLVLPAVAAASVLGSLGATGTALAEAPHAQAKVAACYPVQAKESLNMRTSASTGSTSIGIFPKGARGCYTQYGPGGSYTACGVSYNYWYKVTYNGRSGWVASPCISLV